jgi:hypothetical protein
VYYLPYPREKLGAWCVVHNVNSHDWLYTPTAVGYHDTLMLNGEIGEVYQEEELPTSFIV